MSLETEIENRLNEEYKRVKYYLNKKNCCNLLHKMCQDCERYMGLEQHDYEECKSRPCFKCYLGFSRFRTYVSYEIFL